MKSTLRWTAPTVALALLALVSVHQETDASYAAADPAGIQVGQTISDAVTPVPQGERGRRTKPAEGANTEVSVETSAVTSPSGLAWWQAWLGRKFPTKTPVPTKTPAVAPTVAAPTQTPVKTATPPTAPTSVPPTYTPTSVPPTSVPPTFTPTSVPPTKTPTVVPPTSTPPSSIWRPALQTNWHIQFTGTLDTSVPAQVFDIDLFDTSASTIATLKSKGARLICYMSAGSWEDWRPDAAQFPAVVKGNSNGWAGENYLDIRRIDLLGPIMEKRLDLCKAKGFDSVDFDNVDTYLHSGSGFALTYADQLNYNRYLANAAHARGLSAGLKNDLEQIKDLVAYFDFSINEECFSYNECDMLLPFIQAGKAVFIIEYDTPTSTFCSIANAKNFNASRKRLSLDAWREPCR